MSTTTISKHITSLRTSFFILKAWMFNMTNKQMITVPIENTNHPGIMALHIQPITIRVTRVIVDTFITDTVLIFSCFITVFKITIFHLAMN
jgi:hypothetical protein